MARSSDSMNSVRDILAKLDRSIDQARAKRVESETGQRPEEGAGGARPLRARPLRRSGDAPGPDPGGKWIGRSDD